MSLTDNGGLSAADVAAVMGNNSNGYAWGDGSFWIIILFLFAFMGNGNGFGNYGGTGSEVQRGFDHNAVMNGISGLASDNTTLLQSMNSLTMSMQNCCCENRAATADVKYSIATEAAATRAAGQANTQAILDKLCQLELDGIKQNYENRIANMQSQIESLRQSLTAANNAASQTAQTSRILADNAAQTVALEQYLNPTPVPAYVVQNPNCCGSNFFNGNCCGA